MKVADTKQKAMYIADCPRCNHNRITFDLLADNFIGKSSYRDNYECFFRCRSCFKTSIAWLKHTDLSEHNPTDFPGSYINTYFTLERWVFEIPGSRKVPDHVPLPIVNIFQDGANCLAIEAWDAAGSMFRKALDAATRAVFDQSGS